MDLSMPIAAGVAWRSYFGRFTNKADFILNYPLSLAVLYYSMQMFYDVQEILKQLNYTYFVHKVVINAFYQKGWIEQFVDSSDLVIINYRESIIDAFISHNKAMISGQWKNTKKYNIKYDKLITWDKEKYAVFVEKYRECYTDFFKHTLYKNKKYYLIKYEQLYNPNSMSILQEIIGKKYLLKKPKTIKQTKRTDSKEC